VKHRDLSGFCPLRLLPLRMRFQAYSNAEAMMGGKAQPHALVHPLPPDASAHDHERTRHAQHSRPNRLALNTLAQQPCGEPQRDERRDKGDGDGFGQRQLRQRIEEQQRHERRHHPAQQVQVQHRALRPARTRGEPHRPDQRQRQRGTQKRGRVHSACQRGALHQGIH
jgi:hypothetical protein